jgi:3-hydroxyisobutyrate dehydrogenase
MAQKGESMARIGFIGVGNMGGPMARNLLRAGHALMVFDLDGVAQNAAVAQGAEGAAGAREAARGADVIITMLRNGADVRSVYLDEGVIGAAAPGALLIDCSTIDVETTRRVHAAAAQQGYPMLDAPVSGGVAGADAATLTFMCGGSEEAYARAFPLLQAMGKNIVHCGGPGFGQITKICNNMVAGITALALAEAFVMGEKLGVDRNTLYKVMSTSSAGSFMLQRMCPVPGPVADSASSRGFKPGFAAKLMLKDLRLAQSAAQLAGSASPLGAAAAAAFTMHVANGFGELDTSSIVKLIDPSI